MRKTLFAATLAVFVLLAVLLLNTWRYGQPQPEALPSMRMPIELQPAAQRLAAALRIPTISSDEEPGAEASSAEAFAALQAHLRASFPGVFRALESLPTGSASLLLHWRGSEPSLLPVLLMAHQDVVPVDPTELAAWTHPPFDGVIADGRIWGRGALDNKGALMAIFEAVEALLQAGHQPRRSVYLVLGHDEEIGGINGARAIAQSFAESGTRFSWVLDEGGLIVDRPIPGLDVPVALIGIAEKGFLDVELNGEAPGGHSSKPPRHGAIGQMSAALLRLQEHPMPARLDGATVGLFKSVSHELGFAQRLLFANQWLFEPLLLRLLERQASSDALIRTTTALTQFNAGIKSNVLPTRARATVNFRLLPGDSTDDVLAHVRQQVDDETIGIKASVFRSEPSGLSSADTEAYRLLAGSVLAGGEGDGIVVSPYLTIAATDSRYFEPLADSVYRFNAVRVTIPQVNTIHGINEHITTAEYARLIGFYRTVLQRGSE